jgi:phosphoribosylformimino-5-aminoimidazole carboxamide ribotide isomerase
MQLIPAIDIIDGKCVRLTQGNYSQKKVYHENPLDVARIFEEQGFKRLHLVDLDGAKAGKVQNIHVLESIAAHTNLEIDFGGGIKDEETLKQCFSAGARFATIGSLAISKPHVFETWLMKYGTDKFFVGADVKGQFLAVNGWTKMTETVISDFLKYYINKGLHYFFCTDVSKDGKLEGPSLALYKQLLTEIKPLKLVASGGVSCYDDIIELQQLGCDGVIIGKALYEHRIDFTQLSHFLNK